MAWWL